ncbi:hypothetical protein FA95DRAFT_1136175 [Auriscalpium vulgare]|uniref:Uncharacterized protein n=1 Tax=Auriscalpium vulgare TaxID=40419 RepID=A0ACB8R4P0_9AGAM|nr:hypothetical protein FA95DRAFT_1136175 [Auriscalpium vulgare]
MRMRLRTRCRRPWCRVRWGHGESLGALAACVFSPNSTRLLAAQHENWARTAVHASSCSIKTNINAWHACPPPSDQTTLRRLRLPLTIIICIASTTFATPICVAATRCTQADSTDANLRILARDHSAGHSASSSTRISRTKGPPPAPRVLATLVATTPLLACAARHPVCAHPSAHQHRARHQVRRH